MASPQEVYDWIINTKEIPQYIRFPIQLMSAILFQGTLYMDRTEKTAKICMTLIFGMIIKKSYNFNGHSWFKALALSHLLNFFFNGHPWALVNHNLSYGPISSSHDDLENWMSRLERLGNNSSSIAVIAVYGSYVRDQLHEGSDLDVRVVRYPGKLNGIISSLLICRERTLASLFLFPLDIYLLDSVESLNQLREDEDPEILVDKEDWLL